MWYTIQAPPATSLTGPALTTLPTCSINTGPVLNFGALAVANVAFTKVTDKRPGYPYKLYHYVIVYLS